MRGFRTTLRSDYTWPGFVDALAALLMVLTFLILAFTVGHVHLREMLVESDRTLVDLRGRVHELADLLSLERERVGQMENEVIQLTDDLTAAADTRDSLRATLGETRDGLALKEQALKELSLKAKSLEDDRRAEGRIIEEKTKMLEQKEAALGDERALSARQRNRIDNLSLQITALREQLGRLNTVLEAAEKENQENNVKIVNLGQRLNVALANKVQELSRYRSQFFAQLVEILGDRSDVQIVDDRFIFPSEILFASGSADIEPQGRERLKELADSLNQIAATIPDDIPWVLRIDGHTDQRPIRNQYFSSNWELSTARALSVVNFLIQQGIAPRRLVAAGFSRYHPLDTSSGDDGQQRNRRIEITLTRR